MKSLTEYINNLYITEMANSLNDFERLLDNVLQQIIENWCLVYWCDIYKDNNISKKLRNHWALELKSYINKINKIKLKSGRKDKAIKRVIIEKSELNDPTNISYLISNKFHKEGLSKYIYKISCECSNHIEEICDILSMNNENLIDEYIKPDIG